MNNLKHESDRVGDVVAPAKSGEARKPTGKTHQAKNRETAGAWKTSNSKETIRSGTAKPGGKSKKDQLFSLLSKPNGARISVIVERLGWQAHTVRAALSGLRKQGFEIATSKSAKTGETNYKIVGHTTGESGSSCAASS